MEQMFDFREVPTINRDVPQILRWITEKGERLLVEQPTATDQALRDYLRRLNAWGFQACQVVEMTAAVISGHTVAMPEKHRASIEYPGVHGLEKRAPASEIPVARAHAEARLEFLRACWWWASGSRERAGEPLPPGPARSPRLSDFHYRGDRPKPWHEDTWVDFSLWGRQEGFTWGVYLSTRVKNCCRPPHFDPCSSINGQQPEVRVMWERNIYHVIRCLRLFVPFRGAGLERTFYVAMVPNADPSSVIVPWEFEVMIDAPRRRYLVRPGRKLEPDHPFYGGIQRVDDRVVPLQRG